MSNVNLSIGGRSFAVACAEGEEAHVSGLGQMINAKLSEMGDIAAQSESRMLLFAALLLADELHEANRSEKAPVSSRLDAYRFEALADKLEKLAARLEG